MITGTLTSQVCKLNSHYCLLVSLRHKPLSNSNLGSDQEFIVIDCLVINSLFLSDGLRIKCSSRLLEMLKSVGGGY